MTQRSHAWLPVALKIIRASDRRTPADKAARNELRPRTELPPEIRKRIAEAVHTYFRWCGWNVGRAPSSATIRRTLDLDRTYEERAASVPAGELKDFAVPSWIKDHLDASTNWLRSLQERPRLWLRSRKGRTRNVIKALDRARRFRDTDVIEYSGKENLFETGAFKRGDFEVQDIASQAVGLVCNPEPGQTWWDVCAGEGGKTMHLSDLMNNRGLIWATDRAEWRLKRLKKRAARVGAFNYRSKVWNGDLPLPTKTKFDGVLIDAPCSGVGTWQRDPHARWTTEPNDVRELAELQWKILNNAAASVKPGGRLVYSVCTLTNAETWDIAKRFSAEHKEFEQEAVRNPFGKSDTGKKALMIWPQDFNGNGMFIAVWKRR